MVAAQMGPVLINPHDFSKDPGFLTLAGNQEFYLQQFAGRYFGGLEFRTEGTDINYESIIRQFAVDCCDLKVHPAAAHPAMFEQSLFSICESFFRNVPFSSCNVSLFNCLSTIGAKS